VKEVSTSASSLTSREVKSHYNQFAWAYRRYWGDHIHHGFFATGKEGSVEAQEAMLRFCATRAAVQPGSQVADVGCGHGGTARFLASNYSCQVLGLTISESQLQLARKLSAKVNGTTFDLANAESYSFPPTSFDLIWNMESSEHFFDKAGYIKKVAAALKPGGKLMLAAWSGSMRDPIIRDIAHVFLCPELWTTAQYVEQVKSAGMEIVSQEQLAAEVLPTWDILAGRVRNWRWLLLILPAQFRAFADGIELMREGYRSGQLTYSIVVASKN